MAGSPRLPLHLRPRLPLHLRSKKIYPSQLHSRRNAVMEGISPWMVLALMVGYVLFGVSVLLAVVSLGFLIARRWHQALKLFSAAVLALTLGGALFPVAFTGELDSWRIRMYAFAAGLVLAGIGQFVSARRNPRSYPASFICSTASVGFVAGPLMTYGYGTWLRGILIGGPCILLGLAGLVIAIRNLEKPRSLRQLFLVLVLVNLTVFLLALVNLRTRSVILFVCDPQVIVAQEQLSDLITNTHWRLAFTFLMASALLSAAFFLIWSLRRRPEPAP
jgi:MFS family permease